MLLLLFGCEDTRIKSKPTQNEESLELDKKYKEIEVSTELKILNSAGEITASSAPFSQVKAFFPDDKFVKHLTVQGESVPYLLVPRSEKFLTGLIVFENAADFEVKIRSIFLQGDKTVQIKTPKSSSWSSSITYTIEPKSSAKIPVIIKWDKESLQELTFFPIDLTVGSFRYNGGGISTYRYFVQNHDIDINNELIKEQAFKLDSNLSIENINNYFPAPSWTIDEEKVEIYEDENSNQYTKDRINGLVLENTPYSSSYDMILIDEYGETNIIKKNVKTTKDRKTFIKLTEKQLNEIYRIKNRKFLLITNNREEKILADYKALDLNLKPFLTSYQAVIEIPPIK